MRLPTRLLAACLALPAVAMAGPAEIGTTAAVVPDVKGVLGAEAPRTLSVGARVHTEERITSGANGRTQLLFADGTTLNIGANSDVVLDKYVYDPDRDAGDMAVQMSKGALRFVGGRISKRKKVTVKTPVGTVGIRGGIATVAYAPGGELYAALLYGDALTITVDDVTRTITQPGMAVRIAPDGVPSAVQRIKARDLERASGPMGPPPGAGGGGPKGGPDGARAPGPRPPDGLAGFGDRAAMAAPLPGQRRPGAPPPAGGQGPGIGGPLEQAPPGGKTGGSGPPRPPDGSKLPGTFVPGSRLPGMDMPGEGDMPDEPPEMPSPPE